MRTGFTVVVAVRNAGGTIESCIDSVLSQTNPDVELVVMDGSLDGMDEVFLQRDDRNGPATGSPTGPRRTHHAWNKALDHASGRWI